MKKMILLSVLLAFCSNAYATYTLVATEQKVGTYTEGEMIPEENPKLLQHRIKINETFQKAFIIEQTSILDQNQLEQTNDEYMISYVYSGFPAGSDKKSICLTRKLLMATETILINQNDFQFITVSGSQITIAEGIVQWVNETENKDR